MMNHESLESLHSSEPTTTVRIAECAQQLESLVRRSVTFFQGQIDRLESAYRERMENPQTSDELEQLRRQWRQERAVWEEQQAAAEARINEQLDHLTKAWKELETEQRRLMTVGQPLASEAGPVVHAVADPIPHESLDLIEHRRQSSSATAAIQFQKLKREIRQQARRTR